MKHANRVSINNVQPKKKTNNYTGWVKKSKLLYVGG